jgi:anti-anti-sigma factor
MASSYGHSPAQADAYRHDEAIGRCVSLSTRFRPGATIVEINGEIDASNADRVSKYVGGFLSADRALVLDLSGVDFLGVEGLRVLVSIGQQCTQTGLSWAMITSGAIQRLLRIADSIHQIPTARLVKENLCVPEVLDANRANLDANTNGDPAENQTAQHARDPLWPNDNRPLTELHLPTRRPARAASRRSHDV